MEHANLHYYQAQKLVNEPDVKYYDVRQEPFSIHGLYRPREEAVFKRLPDEVGLNTNEGVAKLYTNPAGGRVRFVTDSRYLAVKTEMGYNCHRSTITLLASAGFDIYVSQGLGETYYASMIPPIDFEDHYELIQYFGDRQRREITLYLPLYNDLNKLEIGLEAGATLEAAPAYAHPLPIVYYGSSITQGACASRPGMAYEAQIARRLNRDFINLGFAGAARGEKIIADYMAGLEFSAFVSDYDHNAPSPEHLAATHFPLYEAVRVRHPDAPYLMLSRPVVRFDVEHELRRREIIMESYEKAQRLGDRNVYFVDGFSLFGADAMEDCKADGTHPNDLGFYRMAETIGKVLQHALAR